MSQPPVKMFKFDGEVVLLMSGKNTYEKSSYQSGSGSEDDGVVSLNNDGSMDGMISDCTSTTENAFDQEQDYAGNQKDLPMTTQDDDDDFVELSPFELKYGSNPQRISLTFETDGTTTRHYITGTDLVELELKRVNKALGLTIDQFLPTSQRDRMDSLAAKKFVLIDLSGTLHIEDEKTDKAAEALTMLRVNGYTILFVTNTTKESKTKLHSRLIRLGFVIDESELFTSLNATRNYILENSLRPMLLVAPEALEEFDGIDLKDPNCVVIGLSPSDFNREKLSSALRLVVNKKAKIIAVHKGRSYRSASGINLGPGCFTVALEMSTGSLAEVLGKPEQKFYQAALKYIGCNDPSEAVMIGDDVRDDVYGAMKSGMTGILVKTGKYMTGDEKKIFPHQPDYVCENFAKAVELLISEKKYFSKK